MILKKAHGSSLVHTKYIIDIKERCMCIHIKKHGLAMCSLARPLFIYVNTLFSHHLMPGDCFYDIILFGLPCQPCMVLGLNNCHRMFDQRLDPFYYVRTSIHVNDVLTFVELQHHFCCSYIEANPVQWVHMKIQTLQISESIVYIQI